MLVEELAAAIRTCARDALDAVARALWAAHGAGQVTDDEAESLSAVIQARRGTSYAVRAISPDLGRSQIEARVSSAPDPRSAKGITTTVPPCPKRAEARERSRRWAAAGRMPPAIAGKFTPGEQAALAVIAFEVSKRQFCDKSMREIGDVAGVSTSTVKRAIRQARELGLLTVQELRLSRYRNDTNVVRIIGKAWLAWIDMRGARGGVQRRTGTDTGSSRKRAERAPQGRVASSNIRRGRASTVPLSCFVRLGKPKADPEQLVLLTDRPYTGKAEALAQPEHGLEALDGVSSRMEGAKASDPRHVLLDPEVVALDALLQVLSDVVDRRTREKAAAPGSHDRGWISAGAIRADPVRCEKRLVRQHLTEEALGRVEIPVGSQQEVDRVAVLVDGSVQVAPLATHLDVGFVDPD